MNSTVIRKGDKVQVRAAYLPYKDEIGEVVNVDKKNATAVVAVREQLFSVKLMELVVVE